MKLFNTVKVLLVAIGICLTLNLSAQENYTPVDADDIKSEVEMADVLRSNGKIYVVVGVVLIIFIGLTAYTIRIDRKITKLEKGEEI
ncbi:MAG: CcmD family protein [Cyclobacteriaceae bacterium]